MSTDSTDRIRISPHPAHQALIALLASAVLVAPAWSWSVAAVGQGDRPLVAAVTGALGTALCAAVAVAAHRAAAVRVVRDGRVRARAADDTLEHEAALLADHLLPALADGVRSGRTVREVLAAHPPVRHAALDRLLRAAGGELDLAARRAEHARALIARCERRITELDRAWLPPLTARIRTDRCAAAEAADPPPAPTGHLPLDDALASLRDHVRSELLAAARRTDTVLAATASCGARLSAGLETAAEHLRVLRETHGDRPEVREDLVEAGRVLARTVRTADTLVTLAGGGTGRRDPLTVPLPDVLRRAARRVGARTRVRARGAEGVEVLGQAAEPLARVLAELLDNAAAFSGPDAEVSVRVEGDEEGIVLHVEDGGPGMRRREREAARARVDSPGGLEVVDGDRTGLAVVGLIAARHRFGVDFGTSPQGGLSVGVLVPRTLVAASGPVPERAGLAS
ncbi:Histidine kinase-, DNA gyrase B-, and HSP90-like ATPase [Nocardiopsis flavescens]|uniref:histidine kinase n=1 Tax=Nocardiopsis flavescens TaxID=758803 RepID=A0A1M6MH62_9ACTN|nr:ATP-binding protein [Nocardiopsis flavescens]SHJ82839.1 Histidine kinase-, DNA gyrase B-, and HSP90-like ATPase [Nocardiopsis flavescens]